MRLLVAVFMIWAAASVRAAEDDAPAGADTAIETAPVILDGRVLFRLRGATALPAAVRADRVSRAIEDYAADESLSLESLHAVEQDDWTAIQAGDSLLFRIGDADARIEELRRASLVHVTLVRLREAVSGYRTERRPEVLRARFTRAGGILVAGALTVLVLIWLGRRAIGWIGRRIGATIQQVEDRSHRLLDAERIWRLLLGVAHFLTFAGIGLAILAALYLTLDLFPWTRGTAVVIRDALADPLRQIGAGVFGYLPKLVFLAIIFYLTRYALRLAKAYFDAVSEGRVRVTRFDPEWSEPTYRLVRFGVIAFAVVMAYPYIPGSQSEAFKAMSLFIGVLFSIGSSSIVSNVVAGYSLTYRRAFRIGDRIRIGDSLGDVTETRLLVTHLRTPKNEEVVIPNSEVLNREVINYSTLARGPGLILHTEVGIGYETPWRQVEAMLLMAAGRTLGLKPGTEPFVRQRALGDFAVVYELNVYCEDASRMVLLYTELHRNILDVFNEYGVQIMTPAYEGDPESPKLVTREEWFAAPARPPDGAG